LIAAEGWTVTGISRHNHDLPKGLNPHSPDDALILARRAAIQI
jgi:hypothetical protein